MSDLSLQLQQALSQLPVSSYFDPALYAQEMQNIFQAGPRYVGHALHVPQVGDFYTLPQENDQRGKHFVDYLIAQNNFDRSYLFQYN